MTARVKPVVVEDAPGRLTARDSELTEISDEFYHRGPTTGGAWVRVPVDALLAVAVYVEVAA